MTSSFRILARLTRGYSITALKGAKGEGLPALIAGSEENDPLIFLEPPEFEPRVIAREPGGYISTTALWREGRPFVLSATEFKPGFEAAGSAIRLYPLDAGECPPSTLVATVAYAHRVDAFQWGGRDYLLVSTLCAGKAFKEDWSQPGGVHLARAPELAGEAWPMRQIVDGLNKNHGMEPARLGREGRRGWLLSAREGLFFLPFPGDPDGPWIPEPLSDEETSDAAAFDWDGDGEPEIFSIGPFHGHVLSMHKRGPDGWTKSTIHDDLALGHIVWAGELLGRPGLLAGSRRERRELRLYRPGPDGSVDPAYQVIDEGIGPSQLAVVPRGSRAATLFVAAHGVNEVRRYDLEN